MPLNAEIVGVWADLCCQGCSKTLSTCCVCVGCRSTTSLFSWEAGFLAYCLSSLTAQLKNALPNRFSHCVLHSTDPMGRVTPSFQQVPASTRGPLNVPANMPPNACRARDENCEISAVRTLRGTLVGALRGALRGTLRGTLRGAFRNGVTHCRRDLLRGLADCVDAE